MPQANRNPLWAHLAIAAVALIFTALFLAQYDTPEFILLWYFTVFIVTTTVPGVLLWRALSAGGKDTFTDLAMGTGLGILLQLALWFVFVSFGVGNWLLLGSVLFCVPFIAVPKLRSCWTKAPGAERLPVWVTAVTAATYSLALFVYSRTFTSGLPPAPNSWYQDQFWHLGNAASLLTRNHIIDMRVAHDPITYHWFSSAHTASQVLTTGIDLPLLFTRMWIVPLFAVIVALAIATGRNLTSAWWPGVLFAVMIVLTPTLNPTGIGVPGGAAISEFSGSQTFSLVVLLLILFFLIQFWRNRRLAIGEWIALIVSLAAAPGSKSSVLPVVICGLALGLLVSLMRRRNWKLTAIPLGVSVVLFLALLPVLGDDGTGARFKFFSSLRHSDFYPAALGLAPDEVVYGGGILPMSLLTYVGILTFSVLVIVYLLAFSWLYAGLPALRRETAHDGGWVLLGMGIAGFAAMMIIDHDGRSQVYFFKAGLIGWYLLASWGVFLVAKRHPRALAVAAGGVLGGVVMYSMLRALVPGLITPERPLRALLIVGSLALIPFVCVLVSLMLARSELQRDTVRVRVFAALIAGSMIVPLTSIELASVPEPHRFDVSPAEYEAADWLKRNSEPDEIIATNSHCWRAPSTDRCNSRSFWVSGFTQRPVLIEGWAYTKAAHSAHGVNGEAFSYQPFHDTELFDLNEAAFAEPSADTMRALKEEGVKWLFAAERRSEVASDIDSYAIEVFSNGDVTIYRID